MLWKVKSVTQLIFAVCGLSAFLLVTNANAQALAPHHDLTYYTDREGKRQEIKTFDDWEIRRRAILKAMQDVMGKLPNEATRVPLEVKIEAETMLDGGIVRQKLTYQSSASSRVPAYLFLPPQKAGSRIPAILCLHQTTRLGKDEVAGLPPGQLSYALDLAKRGYITFAPDYPTFGEHQWDFSPERGFTSGSMKAIWDNIRAVDLLQSLPNVAAERIGCIGHSLGGHNSMFTAAFEPRIKAAVASCGFTRLDQDDLPSWTGRVYMPRIASEYGNSIAKLPFDFPEIVATLAPRAFLTSSATGDSDFNVQGVKDCLTFAGPIYKLYGHTDRLQGYYPQAPHSFPDDAKKVAYEFLDKHLQGPLLADWPQELPATNGHVFIPGQSWPQHPGERRVKVLVHYPGGKLENVTQQTGVMLTLHNWGGTDCVGTASPQELADKLNVIAICVNYLQSGPQASIHDPEPYDFGYLQAIDALRALYFVTQELKASNKPFAEGRIYATGGSGGGNVTLMCGKLAPRTFAALVDICGMSRLTDDMAFNLPGASDLDARWSRDVNSPNYLAPGRQELHFVGNPAHLAVMKKLGSAHRTFIAHGVDDVSCPVVDAKELAANLEQAGLAVSPHFVTKADLDGKAFLSSGHSIGNRTEIVYKIAGPQLEPGGKAALVRSGPSDFELRDEAVAYEVTGGRYIISYLAGYPVARFEPGEK